MSTSTTGDGFSVEQCKRDGWRAQKIESGEAVRVLAEPNRIYQVPIQCPNGDYETEDVSELRNLPRPEAEPVRRVAVYLSERARETLHKGTSWGAMLVPEGHPDFDSERPMRVRVEGKLVCVDVGPTTLNDIAVPGNTQVKLHTDNESVPKGALKRYHLIPADAAGGGERWHEGYARGVSDGVEMSRTNPDPDRAGGDGQALTAAYMAGAADRKDADRAGDRYGEGWKHGVEDMRTQALSIISRYKVTDGGRADQCMDRVRHVTLPEPPTPAEGCGECEVTCKKYDKGYAEGWSGAIKACADPLREDRDRLAGEVERLRAALATPEVYAGVVSSAVEQDRDEVFQKNKELREKLVHAQAARNQWKDLAECRQKSVHRLRSQRDHARQEAERLRADMSKAQSGIVELHSQREAANHLAEQAEQRAEALTEGLREIRGHLSRLQHWSWLQKADDLLNTTPTEPGPGEMSETWKQGYYVVPTLDGKTWNVQRWLPREPDAVISTGHAGPDEALAAAREKAGVQQQESE